MTYSPESKRHLGPAVWLREADESIGVLFLSFYKICKDNINKRAAEENTTLKANNSTL
jgi:hypothetical protein